MDQALLTHAGIDCEKGIERCIGNVALYAQLLGGYPEEAAMTEARRALAEQSYEALYAHLHEIKGVSGNLGIDHVFELTSAMLRQLRSQQYEGLPLYFERLAAAHESAVAAIHAALG